MKSRLPILLAAVAMLVTALAAPASAGGVTSASLADTGWSCFDNSGEGGAGWHCSQTPIGDFIAGGDGVLHLMVFSSPGDEFIGTEILRFDAQDIDGKPCGVDTEWHNLFGNLYACHHWQGGTPPGA